MIRYITQLSSQHPLGFRLLTAILLCSSLMTLLATGSQLYFDYRYELSAIDERIRDIEASSLDSLSTSLWAINPEQVQVQLEGLKQLPDVKYLELETQFDELFVAGEKPLSSESTVDRSYFLRHTAESGREYPLGTLRVVISLEQIYLRLEEKVLVILASQGVKTFLVSVFILTIFHRLVTQHLGVMARYARRLRPGQLDLPLKLSRKARWNNDELSEVVTAMNDMREALIEDIAKRRKAEQALAELNADLEQRVVNRTQELEQTNQELNQTLFELRNTQQKLVESEKMAALGALVAGVAHEINTPIGIGFTAATFLESNARKELKQTPDSRFAETALESSQMIRQNLDRAAQLVTAFKQVSVDQSSEQRRQFNLNQYLTEILTSLQPRLKQANPDVRINCPEELMLDSYPGAIYQLMTNLIINSLIHGFDGHTGGIIEIDVTTDNQRLIIDYGDNGEGIDSEITERIFEPFVTTRRHEGCSGLGMHICYNLVHQLLQGDIQLKESATGAAFKITLPLSVSD